MSLLFQFGSAADLTAPAECQTQQAQTEQCQRTGLWYLSYLSNYRYIVKKCRYELVALAGFAIIQEKLQR